MGSAYLSDILYCEGDFLADTSLKISEILQQSNLLKNDVKSIIDEENINFKSFMRENKHLKSQAEELIAGMTGVEKHINEEIKPELSSCSLELKTLSKSLQEINITLYFLNQLIEIHSIIKNANVKMKSKEFYESAQLITKAQEQIKSDVSEIKNLQLFKSLSNEAVSTYEHLLDQITEIWSSYVTIEIKDKSDVKKVIFSVDINSITEMSEMLKALDFLQYNVIEKKFINMLITNIVNEIIMQKLSVSEKVDEWAVLTLEIPKCGEKPQYSEVFSNVGKVIHFLKKYLSVNIQNGTTFLHKIGTSVGNALAEEVIKNCLSETIPTNSEELEIYNDVVRSTEDFELNLKDCGFLPEKTTCLTDYAKSINVLFANKFCQSYLEEARNLMKKDLHHVAQTDEIIISKISALPKSYRSILKSKLNIQEDDGFIFPKCPISKAAEELIDLVKGMVTEMLRSKEFCAVRLFYTVRNIFEMYSAIVPLHHRKFLESLPYLVALFHNNCMYFTHFLINLTCEHYKKIPTIPADHYELLLEQAILLRTVAVEKLEQFVTNQKSQLVDILRDSGIALLNEDPKLDPNSEKKIRQCIRLLQILQSVWKDVVPLKVYNRAIGFLLDSIIDELISLILAVEDISCQTANDLASMFSIIVERAPKLISEPSQICKHSKNWQKFHEFIGVLNGRLKDIEDRWCDGKGPLARMFTADEVKHLIRALFQNSDRRSALLQRIK